MTRKLLTAIALAAGSLLWAGGASAAMIAAGSALSLNGSDSFNATSITFTNPANIGGETGSFTVLTNCTGCVTMSNINSASAAGLLLYTATEAGPITTTLTTANVPTFAFVGGTLPNLTVTGAGTLTLTGFDPTPGAYIITTQGPTNVSVTFSVTAVPVPTPEPASLAILGSALAGLGVLGRRRRKAV